MTGTQLQWVRENLLAPVAERILYWFMKPMPWKEKAIRLLYLSEFVFSIVTFGLIGGWITRTNAYVDGYRDVVHAYSNGLLNVEDITVKYPSDMYVTIVVTCLSLVVSFALLLGKVRRFIGYTLALHFIAGALTTAWIIAGSVITLRGDGGGGMLDDDQATQQLERQVPNIENIRPYLEPSPLLEAPSWYNNHEIAASIAAALRIFCFLNFGMWAGSLVLAEEMRRRERSKAKDAEKQLPPVPVETPVSKPMAERPRIRQPSIKLATGTGVPYRPPSDAVQEESEDEEPLQFVEITVPVASAVLTTAANPSIPFSVAVGSSTPSFGMYARARYDFIGRETSDLSFAKGDVIRVTRRSDDPNGWWYGERNGQYGEFPGTYVKMIRSTSLIPAAVSPTE